MLAIRFETPKLKADLRRLEVEARNLGGAIAQYGTHRSPTLLSQLSHVENRIDTISRELEEPESEIPDVPIEHIRKVVLQKAKDLEEILMGSPEDAKVALRTHVRPLLLAPIESPDGPLLRVSGIVDLFSGPSDVMPLVAPRAHQNHEDSGPIRSRRSSSKQNLRHHPLIFVIQEVAVEQRCATDNWIGEVHHKIY